MIMNDLAGGAGTLTAGSTDTEFAVQIAHIPCTVFNCFPDIAVGDIAADTNVHRCNRNDY